MENERKGAVGEVRWICPQCSTEYVRLLNGPYRCFDCAQNYDPSTLQFIGYNLGDVDRTAYKRAAERIMKRRPSKYARVKKVRV